MKRIISFVLCLSMLLSLLPVNAFASAVEETEAAVESFPVEERTIYTEAETTSVPETTEAVVETTEVPAETTEAAAETAGEPAETTETVAETTEESTVPEENVDILEATEPAMQETVPGETEEAATVEVLTWVPDRELPSDEELFAAYAQRELYGYDIATWGTAARETLDDDHKLIYDALAPDLRRIASGERGSAVIAVGADLGEQTVPLDIKLPDGSVETITVTCPCTPSEEAQVNVTGIALDIQTLLDALLADMPYDLYWFDKTWGVSALTFRDCFVFYFTVAGEYREYEDSGEYYNAKDYVLDTDLTGAATAAAENAQKIVTEAQDYSDYGKLATYVDYIMAQTDYNKSAASGYADYGNPWQLIWVFDGNSGTKVVCEGYSKAFQYLCDLSEFDNDILCYSAIGYLNPSAPGYGAHMWNIVTVNGSPYLVDVTNCDAGFDLFLRGGAISKGVYYYDNGEYHKDADTNGTYKFDSCTFVYDRDTIELWGEAVTTLATEDLTEATFPENADMTGEKFAALLAGSNTEITVSKALVITNDVTVPAGKRVIVQSPGTVTVANGGALTVEGNMEFPGTGLTVQSGGSLTLKGQGRMGFYGGSFLTIETGGTYAILDKAEIYANQGTVLTNITRGEVCNSNMVLDAGTGLEGFLADCGAAEYKTFYLDIATNYTISSATTLPDNVAVTNYGNTITVADGGTLTLEGSWTLGLDATADGGEKVGGHLVVESGGTLVLNGPMELLYGSTLTLESGAELVNVSTLSVDAASSLTNNGTIENSGTIAGTIGGSGTVIEPAMDGAWLIGQLENCTEVNYELTARVVIDSDVVLPTFPVGVINISGNGSLTIKDGGSVTTENNLDASRGGVLAVEAGGSLETTGWISAGAYGTVVNKGSCVAGGYSMNYPGTITGIEPSEINLFAHAWDEASLIETLGFQGYNVHEVNIGDLKGDRNPEPVVLTKDITIPETCSLVIGDEMGLGAVLEIADGVTLTNNSTISLCHGASLILGEGAAIAGSGTISSEGTILSYGTIENTLTGNGTVTECMSQAQFEALLRESSGEAVIDRVLVLTENVTIPEQTNLAFEAPGSLTVSEGVRLTVEGCADFRESSLTVCSGGSLRLIGVGKMGFYGGGALTIEEGADCDILDLAEIYASTGTVLSGITRAEVVNSNTLNDSGTDLGAFLDECGAKEYKTFYLTIAADCIVSGDTVIPGNVVTDQYGSTLTITNGAELTVNGDWELGMEVITLGMAPVSGHIVIEDGSLVTNGLLILTSGSSLTVAEGCSYTCDGIFCTDGSSSVVNRGSISLRGDYSLNGDWQGNAFDGVLLTQDDLQAQLNRAEGKVYLSNSLTLNKDLTVPAGARLVIAGGSITIPAERTLTIDGTLLIGEWGSLSVVEGGTIVNNGLLRNEATLDLREGVYRHGEDAELVMARLSVLDGANTDYTLLYQEDSDIFRDVTILMEGWDIGQLNHLLKNLDPDNQPKELRINICGELTLEDVYAMDPYGPEWVLPEYATLFVGDLGYGSAVLTVSNGHTLTNNGSIEIGRGGTLVVESGAELLGSLPVCHEGGSFENANTQYLEGLLDTDTTLTGHTVVTGTLEVSSNATLTISGEGAGLFLAEGAQLVNGGSIIVEKDAVLDVSAGDYVEGGGWIRGDFHCDADGNVTRATVRGIDAADRKYGVYTESGDALIREMIGYVSGLVNSGAIPDPFALGDFFYLDFAGETVLSGDLEIPAWSVPYVSGTLTVPGGVTLTDRCGMVITGTLAVEGLAVADGCPIYVESGASLVNPENCVNYVFEDLYVNSITIEPDRAYVLTGEQVGFTVSRFPVGAYDTWYNIKDISYEIVSGTGTLDETNTLTSDTAGPVTVRATLVDYYDEYGQPVLADISAETTVIFVEDRQVRISVDAPDFLDEHPGLYAGSSTGILASVAQGEEFILPENLELSLEGGSGFAVLTRTDGGYVLEVSDGLDTRETITIHGYMTDDSAIPDSLSLDLRPRASAVDVALDGEAVTGETVTFDLNSGNSVTLMPAAEPAGACNAGGTAADGTPLVRWKSSDKNIATVENGVVTFHKTGKVKITMTADFGGTKSAAVTFQVVKLVHQIRPGKETDSLIGGSSATYSVYNAETDAKLKSSAVKWSLCDQDGNPISSHPYASVTTSGKLTTKTVADAHDVYLLARVANNESASCMMKVTLYPAVGFARILEGEEAVSGTLRHDMEKEGKILRLSWTAGPYLESVKSASWKSSATKVATISGDGLIQVKKPGTAKFTLTVTALNNKKTTVSVTMKFGIFTEDLLLSATLPDKSSIEDLGEYLADENNVLTLTSGKTITFRAKNVPDNVTTAGVNWSLEGKSFASISSKGVLKAKTVSNPEIVTVFVESKDGGYEGTYREDGIPVVILPAPEAVLLWTGDYEFVAKTTQRLERGETLRLEASEDVTWTTSKSSVATVEDGLITAVAKGTATITAKTEDGRKAYLTVKVSEVLEMVTITTKKNVDFEVASGKYLDLVGTAYYEDGTKNTSVSWSVNDTSLATISSSGRLTAAKGLRESATVRVTATSKDTGYATSRNVRILPLTTGVEIFGTFGTAYPRDVSNTTRKWDLTVQNNTFDLKTKTFPEGTMGVTWKSSNTKITRVDKESGRVECLKDGTVTITATAKDGSGKKASFKLTVHRTMREGTLTLPETGFIGGGKKLTMTKLSGYAIDPLATNKTLKWTLSYPDGGTVSKRVATLSSKGVLTTKTVKEPVELLITATATDGSGELARCLVTVYPLVKGVTLYLTDEAAGSVRSVNKKTVSVPINESVTILPDTTNKKGFGYEDDKTADEYLEGGDAWQVVPSVKNAVGWEFNGQELKLWADGAAVGKSVKITLKARDGSGKSAYFTVKFTEPAVEEPASISVILHDTGHSDSWHAANWANYESAAVRGTDEVTITNCTDEESQKKAFIDAVAQGSDYIVLDPIVSSGWEATLEEAAAAGIPVILAGSPVDEDTLLYAASVCNDLKLEGQLAGAWLAKYLYAKGQTEANILILSGDADSPITIGREAGFASVAQAYPEWTILDSRCGSSTQDGGYEAMMAVLEEYGYPDSFDVVLCQNEDMAYGAQLAMEDWGIDFYGAGSDVTVISFDATREGLEATLNGYIHCNVESGPFCAEYVFEIIRKMKAGEDYDACTWLGSMVYVTSGTHTEDEVFTVVTQELLEGREY